MKKMNFLMTTITTALFSGIVFAATDSDNLFLQGVVAEETSIEVTANAEATNLNIIEGETGLLIGSSVERSNSLNGYTVSFYSANGGELQNASDPTVSTTYEISYGGGSFLSPGTSGSPQVLVTEAGVGSAIEETRDISINVTAFPNAIVGSYEDTVTFVIESL